MQRSYLASNPIPGLLFGMAVLALAIGAFILTVTGSLREALDLALSQEEATVSSITVRVAPGTGPGAMDLASQEAVIRRLRRVEGVQGVAATLRGSFKPEEERYNPTVRLPDVIQGTWSDLSGLEFPPPDSGAGLLSGRLPRPVLSSLASLTVDSEGPANINEAVIGYELAQRLGKQVGDTLVVNERPLVIVGIWQPSILSPGNVVQVPYDTIRQLLPRQSPELVEGSERSFEMTVVLAPGYDAETVARRIWDQVPQVELSSPAQERAERQQAMLALDLVVLYSVLLTILVGGATTLNATLMATHELSTISHRLSAISYRLTQPLLATFAGGLGGLLAGWLAVLGLNAYTVHHQARTLFIATPRLAGEVVLLSVLVGLAAGVWPALWTRLRPRPEQSRRERTRGGALSPVLSAVEGPVLSRSPERNEGSVEGPVLSAVEGLSKERKPEAWLLHRLRTFRPSALPRSWLAVLGVALVTPGVMLIGSLVESLYCSLGEGERTAANRISLEPTSSQVAYYEPLADALRRWPGILGIAVEAYGGAIIEEEERWIDRLPPSGIVYGFRSDREDFGLDVPYRVGLWQGRVFQPGSLDEAVIGYDLAAQQRLGVGDTLTIRDHDFTVVGIRQQLIYGCMRDFNFRAEVSLEALRRILGQPYAFGTITAFIPPAEREEDREVFLVHLEERFSGTAVVTVKDRLAEIARDFPGVESLIVESSDDTLLRARLLYFGLLAGVAIPLWGLAGLGMMSGLELSLAESRQEIQLRKLFGASDGDILARWLERAVVWGGIGGLIGMGAGWLVIEAVNFYVNSCQRVLTLIFTPRLVVTTLVVTVLLGVMAGLGPAWQAARLSPFWEDEL